MNTKKTKELKELHDKIRREAGKEARELMLFIQPLPEANPHLMVVSETPNIKDVKKHKGMVKEINEKYEKGEGKYAEALKKHLLNPTVPIYNFLYALFECKFNPLRTCYWTHSAWGKVRNKWLKEELKTVKPKILITLGGGAAKAVNPLREGQGKFSGIVKLVEERMNDGGIELTNREIASPPVWFPLLHPSGQNQGNIHELNKNKDYQRYLECLMQAINP